MSKLRKILLVDDDEHTNFLNQAIIRHAKFAEEVVAQMTASEALEYIRNQESDGDLPDLIFLDINMPLMDGWEFMQEYSELLLNGSAPKVIMLTSSINPKDLQRAQEVSGIAGFRSKPLSSEVLNEIYDEHFAAAV